MIRTKNKILAEANDPNTVLSSGPILNNRLIVGAGNKSVKCKYSSLTSNKLIVSTKTGSIKFISLAKGTDVIIGTDAKGEIVLYDRSEIS